MGVFASLIGVGWAAELIKATIHKHLYFTCLVLSFARRATQGAEGEGISNIINY